MKRRAFLKAIGAAVAGLAAPAVIGLERGPKYKQLPAEDAWAKLHRLQMKEAMDRHRDEVAFAKARQQGMTELQREKLNLFLSTERENHFLSTEREAYTTVAEQPGQFVLDEVLETMRKFKEEQDKRLREIAGPVLTPESALYSGDPGKAGRTICGVPIQYDPALEKGSIVVIQGIDLFIPNPRRHFVGYTT